MKGFILTVVALVVIIAAGTLVQQLLGAGGIGVAAAAGIMAGELGWAKIVKPD